MDRICPSAVGVWSCLGAATLALLAAPLDAQGVEDRVRERAQPRMEARQANPGVQEAMEVSVWGRQPLRFDDLASGEVRTIDPRRDEAFRAEFDLEGRGAVEIEIDAALSLAGREQSLALHVLPSDILLTDLSGSPIPVWIVEQVSIESGSRVRIKTVLDGGAHLFMGGSAAADREQHPGEYVAAIRVTAFPAEPEG